MLEKGVIIDRSDSPHPPNTSPKICPPSYLIPLRNSAPIPHSKYGAFDLPAAHIFKIRDGKVYEIEAIGYMAEHGITNGWE